MRTDFEIAMELAEETDIAYSAVSMEMKMLLTLLSAEHLS